MNNTTNEKSAGSRTTLMRKGLLSKMITNHAHGVGSLSANERFEVEDVKTDEDLVEVTGEIFYEEIN